jgi:hypothetical protein
MLKTEELRNWGTKELESVIASSSVPQFLSSTASKISNDPNMLGYHKQRRILGANSALVNEILQSASGQRAVLRFTINH